MEIHQKDIDDLLKLRTWNDQKLAPTNTASHSYFEGHRSVKELSPKDFNSASSWKLKENKCAIILFYKPGCRYCQDVKPQWKQLGETAAFFNVYALNVAKYHAHVAKIKEEMPSLITSYPTIIIYENGEPKEHYQGVRDWKHLTLACARVCSGDHADKVRDIQLLLSLSPE
jgi:thiol-disulfide isomerase/thioredoxin